MCWKKCGNKKMRSTTCSRFKDLSLRFKDSCWFKGLSCVLQHACLLLRRIQKLCFCLERKWKTKNQKRNLLRNWKLRLLRRVPRTNCFICYNKQKKMPSFGTKSTLAHCLSLALALSVRTNGFTLQSLKYELPVILTKCNQFEYNVHSIKVRYSL